MKQKTYFVKGTHCASCELIIEKTLIEQKGIEAVEASNGKGEVTISYEGSAIGVEELNRMFKKQGYSFSDRPQEDKNSWTSKDWLWTIGSAVMLIAAFVLLIRSGFSSWVNVDSTSSLPVFFIFGIIAGLSTCAALVGGLVLSMAKQWSQIYATNESAAKKFQPHLMFNAGRLASYFLLGAALGAIGSKLQISLGFSALLILVVSILMIFLGLQMLGVRALSRFQLAPPKFLTRRVSNEKNFQGKYMPFVMGALTFFLPCGFTITAQSLALISGSWLQGGLIMLAFVLGTTPILLAIGFSSLKLVSNPSLAGRFLKVAGVLVLFFALFNANNQLNVMGLPSFNDLSLALPVISSPSDSNNSNNGNPVDVSGLPPIVNGQQVIKMEASSAGYKPNSFKVRTGVPIRWEIKDVGTSGCTNAVIAKGLFSGQIDLVNGQTSVKEFTIAKAGKYKFSCWMGMISGVIEAVDVQESQAVSPSVTDGAVSNSVNNGAVNNSVNNSSADNSQASVASGPQIIKMEASSSGYRPNYFKVNAGQPVRWEITDTGTSGCTNAVVAQGLFTGQIDLTNGQTSVKEFVAPTKPGQYGFSCWMGMVRGTIEVVSANGSDVSSASNSSVAAVDVPSGAKGCGCGGSR